VTQTWPIRILTGAQRTQGKPVNPKTILELVIGESMIVGLRFLVGAARATFVSFWEEPPGNEANLEKWK
jgi:hypothetical protein